MDVQDLINQQAARHINLPKADVEVDKGNTEGDKGIDPLYNLFHRQGKVKISNGVTIESL